jgi:NADH dehydrogenase FAD-containing subunit
MRYVVIGSGVAGVSCLRALVERLRPDDVATLVSPSDVAKARPILLLYLY